MKDEDKTKEQLVEELQRLRQQQVEIHEGHDNFNNAKYVEALQMSELRFRKYYELGLIGMATSSLEKGLVDFNDTLCNMFGYSRKEFGKLTWTELTHPDDLEADLAQFNRVLSGEIEGYSMEKRFFHKDGNIIYTELSVNALRKNDGSVDYFVALVHDITEYKQTEKALQRSNSLLSSVIESPENIIIFALDRNYNYLSFNKAHIREMKKVYDADIEIGKHIFTYIPREDDRLKAEENYKRVLEGERFFKIDEYGQSKNRFWYQLFYNPIFDVLHHVIGFTLFCIDITEHKLAEEARLMLENKLRQSQKMEAIGTLAGGIAHDFNNLLTPILGYTQLAKMNLAPNAKGTKYLEKVEESANRAKDLVQKVLLVSRKTTAITETVQLKNLVEEVLAVFQASIPANIDLRQEIDFDLPLISADSSQIYQMILNLCTNAVQAMPEGGELTIRLNKIKHSLPLEQEQTSAEFICLSVQDNGCGIDSATLERIYDPFFTTKEKGEQRGTGLGLSIVSGVVKQHRGHIEVESISGGGTIFRIYFPVLMEEKAHSSKESETLVGFGNEHILLIDDDEMVCNLGADILEELGCQVTNFTDSQEAFQTFEENPQDFQLVISDYSMPGLTGPQLMKKMKAIRSDIPILLITGYANLATPENLQEWGCDGIVVKPYDVKKLSQTISQVLAKAKS